MIFGTGATTTRQRFTSLAATGKYYNEVNLGIGGSNITELVTSTIPAKLLSGDIVVFDYITNDCQDITSATFKSTYQTVIDYCKNSRGYAESDIYLIKGFYYDANNPNNIYINPSNYNPFLTAIDEIKTSRPLINIVPLYQLMTDWVAANGTTLNVAADGVHFNDAGHRVAADFFKLFI